MKCPSCQTGMKVSHGTPSHPVEYLCLNCGRKSPGPAEAPGRKLDPAAPAAPPWPEPAEVSKRKKNSTISRMRRLDAAKRFTELKQLSKDFSGRVSDMEIQFDRRLEELQNLAVELERLVELYRE